MKKVVSICLMSLLMILSSGGAVFAQESSGTPSFAINNVDEADEKNTIDKISPGSTFEVDFVVTNLDPSRSITLGFNVTGTSTENVISKPIPKDWAIFDPQNLVILPKGDGKLTLKIVVPDNADLGLYEGIAKAVLQDFEGKIPNQGAVKIDLASGVKLKFEVVKSSEKTGENSQSDNSIPGSDSNPSSSIYIYVIVAVLVVLLLVYFINSSKPKKKG